MGGAPPRVGEGALAQRSQRCPAEIGARLYVTGDGADMPACARPSSAAWGGGRCRMEC